MVQASNLGYPRIGSKRELKQALEQFWSGKRSETDLLEQAATLRTQHWQLQQHLGLAHIPSNDFSSTTMFSIPSRWLVPSPNAITGRGHTLICVPISSWPAASSMTR